MESHLQMSVIFFYTLAVNDKVVNKTAEKIQKRQQGIDKTFGRLNSNS